MLFCLSCARALELKASQVLDNELHSVQFYVDGTDSGTTLDPGTFFDRTLDFAAPDANMPVTITFELVQTASLPSLARPCSTYASQTGSTCHFEASHAGGGDGDLYSTSAACSLNVNNGLDFVFSGNRASPRPTPLPPRPPPPPNTHTRTPTITVELTQDCRRLRGVHRPLLENVHRHGRGLQPALHTLHRLHRSQHPGSRPEQQQVSVPEWALRHRPLQHP